MSDSRKRFEEWARSNRWHDFNRIAYTDGSFYLQPDLQKLWEGWSARDSEVERLREALKDVSLLIEAEFFDGAQERIDAALSSQDKESA